MARKKIFINKARYRTWEEVRGSELVEFALALPLLLTLLVGSIWIARAFNVWQTITRAAREGARYAVLPSCATCGTSPNTLPDMYTTINSCLGNPTTVFTNHVLPFLQAANLKDPTTLSGGSYCQEAVWNDPDASDTSTKECAVQVNMTYPLQLVIPFTPLNLTTVNITTRVKMRMENQPLDTNTGSPLCPGDM